MAGRRARQAKLIANDYAVVLVAVVLVVTALGGVLVYTTYIAPGTETTTATVHSWETEAGFSHGATVVEDTRAFAAGEVVEDRSVYFTGLMPTLEGTFAFAYRADSGALEVEAATTLRYRAVQDGEELWRVDEPIDAIAYTAGPDDPVELTFALDVPALIDELDAIEEELGASPGTTEVAVIASVAATGQTDGHDVVFEDEYRLVIDPGSATYHIDADGGAETHPITRTVEEPRTYGAARSAGGPALLLLGVLGILGLIGAHHRGVFEITDAEREAVAFEAARVEFDEWITRGTVPDTGHRDPIAVSDLAGLVDVAIDSNARVIEDPEAGAYVVFADGYRYEYHPPAPASIPR